MLTIMVYGQQDTVMSFIRFLIERDMVKVIEIEDWGGWDSSLACKDWILAESLLFLNRKALV
jgi:hypothetical protein